MNIILAIACLNGMILIIGRYLEKIRMPWIFAALLLGVVGAWYNPFSVLIDSDFFVFTANLGMYFLLFLVGLEIDIKKMKKQSFFIFKATALIILFEGICGSLIIHLFFNYEWSTSFLVALSFATVGEAILIPILDEFKIINSRLGQAIIGIGTADDVFEILILITAVVLIGVRGDANILMTVMIIVALCVSAFLITRFSAKANNFRFYSQEIIFLFVLTIFFFLCRHRFVG